MQAIGETNEHIGRSLVQQIADTISKDIDRGVYHRNEKLLSINIYSKKYGVARDTIEKAYIRLKQEGYIQSVPAKGYFVIRKQDAKIKVLLLFNKLSSYKKIVYDAIVATLGDKAKVDLHIHHYDPDLLDETIAANIGNYHYYLVMPHFFEDVDEVQCLNVLRKIPSNQLILLDKDLPKLSKQSAIYQDFRNDIYGALNSVPDLMDKYERVGVIFPLGRHHPVEIKDGVKQYCIENGKKLVITHEVDSNDLKTGTVYIVLTEDDLVSLIKRVNQSGQILGKDIGIISFNETVFKELLDITVITTDFEQMGKTAAGIILNNTAVFIQNPFQILIRKSL